MLVLGASGYCALRMGEREQSASWLWLGSLLINLIFILLFLIYPSTSSQIFPTFQCIDLDDGSRKLRADLLVDCDSDAHSFMTGYAI